MLAAVASPQDPNSLASQTPLKGADQVNSNAQLAATVDVAEEIIKNVTKKIGGTLKFPADPLEVLATLQEINKKEVIDLLKQKATAYVHEFSYKQIASQSPTGETTYNQAVRSTINPGTLDTVVNILFLEATRSNFGIKIIRDALLKPEVLAKLSVEYEHAFMLGATTPESKSELLRKTIGQLVEQDAVMRFVRSGPALNGIDLYQLLSSDPQSNARATLAHRWACQVGRIDPFDTDAQLKSGFGYDANPITRAIFDAIDKTEERNALERALSNLRSHAPIHQDPDVIIGESTFFQPLLDRKTATLSQYLLDAFERGLNNVEVAIDMLPFDPTKRLPGEFTDEDIANTRELAKTLNISITIHSPIVGPSQLIGPADKKSMVFLLEDAADNVKLMVQSLELCEKLGAKTFVMHFSDRLSPEAIKNYAQIALAARGKMAADGTPLCLACENYMSKQRPDGSKPFATMAEHFDTYKKVAREVIREVVSLQEDPTEALSHLSILIDAAHLNLVTDLDEDPLKAPLDLMDMANSFAEELLSDSEYGAILKSTGFEVDKFVTGLVAQLHLNENMGPVLFKDPKKDFSADFHLPVESSGTIDLKGFVSLIHDLGFCSKPKEGGKGTLVILAEQKERVSPGGVISLYDWSTDCPSTDFPPGRERVNHFISEGKRAIEKWAGSDKNKGHYERVAPLLKSESGELHAHYAYLAGRFGIKHLLTHCERRAYHHLFAAPYDGKLKAGEQVAAFSNLKVSSHLSGELIIKKGTTLDQARKEGSNKCYIVIDGALIVEDAKPIRIEKGMPVGEQMFLNNSKRNANVLVGEEGAVLLEIPEPDFWMAVQRFPALTERLYARLEHSGQLQEPKAA